MIVLENDLYRHAPAARIDAALANVNNLIVLDHQRTALQEKANLILSAASFAESDGTLINQEGRAQRFFQVYDPAYYDDQVVMLESWRWLHSLHSTYLNRQVDWTQLDHIIDAAAAALPQLAGIKHAAPDAGFRIHGQKLAREPHCYSGRTAMRANINVHEPRVPQDQDTMFAFSMEGNNAPQAPRQQVAFAWAPGWNSPRPGISSRMRWAAICATATPGCGFWKRVRAGWIISARFHPPSRSPRTAAGASRPIGTCSAARTPRSALRSSRSGCRRPMWR
ncbi:NADH-quinone oxidoreductase subunit G [Sodalis praecaptivus]